MTEKEKWKKRLGFKVSIKSKWVYTSWYLCERWEVPYALGNLISLLQENLDSKVIFYKIEIEEEK